MSFYNNHTFYYDKVDKEEGGPHRRGGRRKAFWKKAKKWARRAHKDDKPKVG